MFVPHIKLEDLYKEVKKIESKLNTSEIKNIKKELSMIKMRQSYLEDALVSADDVKALAQARKDLKERKTISLSELKRKFSM